MAKRWSEIRKPLGPAAEQRTEAWIAAEIARLPLAELRRAREMTQIQLAAVLHVDQGAISKLEKRSDMYLSTLRSYVEALGGHLDVRAIFPQGEVVLESLSNPAAQHPKQPEHARAS